MSQCCQQETRREDVRELGGWYGLDYAELGNTAKSVNLYFLGKLPPELRTAAPGLAKYLTLTGGERITGIQITQVSPVTNDNPETDEFLAITVSQTGDFSNYTLGLTGVANVDPRFSQACFTFKIDCPTGIDCVPPCQCGPQVFDEPAINYLAKDFSSFFQLIMDRMATLIPAWQETHTADLAVMIAELFAYTGDYLSYYQDAVSTEAYLETARQRISVRRHARLVGYHINEGCNARAFVAVVTSEDLTLDSSICSFVTGMNSALQGLPNILEWTDLAQIPPQDYEVFEPLPTGGASQIQLVAAQNEIDFYTWGELQCCLEIGSTSATLLDQWVQAPAPAPAPNPNPTPNPTKGSTPPSTNSDAVAAKPAATAAPTQRALQLKPGDVLIFEEVIGPGTGNPADADPTHRCAVRLTSVTPGEDPVLKTNGQPTPIVTVTWGAQDALMFPVCISAMGPAPGCQPISNVSIARGNVILVDHGKTQPSESLGQVPTLKTNAKCLCENLPGDVEIVAGTFYPQLAQEPLTFAQPLPKDNAAQGTYVSAATLLVQNVRCADPEIQLSSAPAEDWSVRYDLIESQPGDANFVVEIDNNGYAHLRFGDGTLGMQPAAAMTFQAVYRVGNGTAGNVGAESITRLVLNNERLSGVSLTMRNPLPASGGTDPEPIEQIKLIAPYDFQTQLKRAIIAADYAQLAEENPSVQSAAAALEWTGSWYEADVAVDPFGSEDPSPALLTSVFNFLECYRRIGHDLRVLPAVYVPLDLALSVCALPGYAAGEVLEALLDVFSNGVLAGGALGFFNPDNLTFGQSIYLSQIVATAMAVPGVECVRVVRFHRLFSPPNSELQNGVLPLAVNEIAQLDNDPNFPEHGKLAVQVLGGS
jgi:Baseplate J-like protein